MNCPPSKPELNWLGYGRERPVLVEGCLYSLITQEITLVIPSCVNPPFHTAPPSPLVSTMRQCPFSCAVECFSRETQPSSTSSQPTQGPVERKFAHTTAPFTYSTSKVPPQEIPRAGAPHQTPEHPVSPHSLPYAPTLVLVFSHVLI